MIHKFLLEISSKKFIRHNLNLEGIIPELFLKLWVIPDTGFTLRDHRYREQNLPD